MKISKLFKVYILYLSVYLVFITASLAMLYAICYYFPQTDTVCRRLAMCYLFFNGIAITCVHFCIFLEEKYKIK